MSDYRRWISYIYLYENGVKKENAGYARIELQNGRVKLAMYINRARRDGVVDACYFKNQAGHFGVARLGEIDLSEPSPVFRHEGDASNISGSGLFFQELNGILLTGTGKNGSYYASSWEDAPVLAADVEEIRKLLSHGKEKTVNAETVGQEQKESSMHLSEVIEGSKEQNQVQEDKEIVENHQAKAQSTEDKQVSETETSTKIVQQSTTYEQKVKDRQQKAGSSPKMVQQKTTVKQDVQSSRTAPQKTGIKQQEIEQSSKEVQQKVMEEQLVKNRQQETEPTWETVPQRTGVGQQEIEQSLKTAQQKMMEEQSVKNREKETEPTWETAPQKTGIKQQEIEQSSKEVQQKVMEEQLVKNYQQETESTRKTAQQKTGVEQQEAEQLFKMVQQNVASEQAARNGQVTAKQLPNTEAKDVEKLKEQETIKDELFTQRNPRTEVLPGREALSVGSSLSEEAQQNAADRKKEKDQPITEQFVETAQKNGTSNLIAEKGQQETISEQSGKILTEESSAFETTENEVQAQPVSSCVRPVRTSTKEQALTAGCRNVSCSLSREERIFYCLPPMYPFEDGEFEKGVRLEPQDIGMLPRNVWKLAGNSFLLHAFYTYHHLLFMRKRQKEGTVCYLMLPGVYDKREQRMAQMFGFSNFRPVKCQQLEAGVFGYWYMEVRF